MVAGITFYRSLTCTLFFQCCKPQLGTRKSILPRGQWAAPVSARASQSIGAGLGIGLIGGQSAEAMARQPERAGQIQTAGLILAALIEGATLFAIVVAFVIQSKFNF